ncbi:MAG: hypothetical protein HYR51_11305 [Candidatus Rokubacteria bacterium]|nr:hypothetical protein [Candidatus Rokubacteria bacterium]
MTPKNRHPETDWGAEVGREAWIALPERRLDQVAAGAVETRSAETVLRKARAKLR